jgi:hypothetical protein
VAGASSSRQATAAKGAGDARRVARDRPVVAAAVALIAEAPAAGAGVGRGDELEVRREHARVAGADDCDPALFEDLAHGLEGVAVELRELVEEEHPAVGQRHLAGTGWIAASQQPRGAGGVVGRAEGALRSDRDALAQLPRGAVDPRDLEGLAEDLEGLAEVERRKQTLQAAGQHGLAAAGRSAQQQAVASCGGHLQGPLGALLAADLREVGSRRRGHRLPGRGGGNGQRRAAAQIAQHAAEVGGRQHLDLGSEPRLGRVAGGHDYALAARVPHCQGEGEGPAHRPQAPVQGELSDQAQAGEARRLEGTRRGQDGHGDGEVEADAPLAEAGRRQIDGDAAFGKALPGAGDGGAHPGGALADGRFG